MRLKYLYTQAQQPTDVTVIRTAVEPTAIRGDSAAIRGDSQQFAATRGDSRRFVAIRGNLLISDTRHLHVTEPGNNGCNKG